MAKTKRVAVLVMCIAKKQKKVYNLKYNAGDFLNQTTNDGFSPILWIGKVAAGIEKSSNSRSDSRNIMPGIC